MASHAGFALALVALLAAPALAETDVSYAERRVVGDIAFPVELLLRDAVAWRVDVPAGTLVEVSATDAKGSLFYLRANRTLSGLWLPGPSATLALDEAGPWRVEVDPAAGAPVDVRVRFRGYVGDFGGAPAPFSIQDLEPERGCVTPGVCLP